MANTTESETTVPDVASNVAAPSRDDIRKQIFSKKYTVAKKVPVPFNGAMLEFRQPSVDEMSSLRDSESDRNFMVVCLIHFCFIPDTDIKVFDEADYDQILKMPYGGGWAEAIKAISEILDLRVEEKVKN